MRVFTKDGHVVVQLETNTSWEVFVCNRYGGCVRRDTAMDKGSSDRWFRGAVKQHGGARWAPPSTRS